LYQPDEEDGKYYLSKFMEGTTDEETVEVFLAIDARGALVWQNLPFKFMQAMNLISSEDQMDDPIQCLVSIATTFIC